jgi:hypothetical protein
VVLFERRTPNAIESSGWVHRETRKLVRLLAP